MRTARAPLFLAASSAVVLAVGACGYDFKSWDFGAGGGDSAATSSTMSTSRAASASSGGGQGGTLASSSVTSVTVSTVAVTSVASSTSSTSGGGGAPVCQPNPSPGVEVGVPSCNGAACNAGDECCLTMTMATCNFECCPAGSLGELRCQNDFNCKTGYYCCAEPAQQGAWNTDCVFGGCPQGTLSSCAGIGICGFNEACQPLYTGSVKLESEFPFCFPN